MKSILQAIEVSSRRTFSGIPPVRRTKTQVPKITSIVLDLELNVHCTGEWNEYVVRTRSRSRYTVHLSKRSPRIDRSGPDCTSHGPWFTVTVIAFSLP